MRGGGILGFLLGAAAAYTLADWMAHEDAKRNFCRKTGGIFRHDPYAAPPMTATPGITPYDPSVLPGYDPGVLLPPSEDFTVILPPELAEGGYLINSPFNRY